MLNIGNIMVSITQLFGNSETYIVKHERDHIEKKLNVVMETLGALCVSGDIDREQQNTIRGIYEGLVILLDQMDRER
jgi:hypothetical protein